MGPACLSPLSDPPTFLILLSGRRVEPQYMAPADYMSQQTDINEKMRAILVDWLVEARTNLPANPLACPACLGASGLRLHLGHRCLGRPLIGSCHLNLPPALPFPAGPPQVQADARDAVPDHLLHRPVPRQAAGDPQEPAAGRGHRHAHRLQVRGDLGARGEGLPRCPAALLAACLPFLCCCAKPMSRLVAACPCRRIARVCCDPKKGLSCPALTLSLPPMPQCRDFVYISDKAYTREQILGMEKQMLNALGFQLTVPTPYLFLQRWIKAAKAEKARAEADGVPCTCRFPGVPAAPQDHLPAFISLSSSAPMQDTAMLAQYLVELALVDYQSLRYTGSLLAAAAVYTAQRCMSAPEPWGYALERHTGLSAEDLHECAAYLTKLQRKAPTASLTAVYKKFSNPKYLEAAKISCDAELAQ